MLAAWLVHLLTASGGVLAFLALVAIVDHEYRAAFLWLVLAVLIDSVDGLLARRARVADRLPWFNGSRLDDIVDYLTFVFVPVFLLHHAGGLPAGLPGTAVASLVLLSSAYGFSRGDAKTADHFFTGFPSYWNVVALYLFALQTTPRVNAVILVILAALIFVPMGYLYPSRNPTLRWLTVALGVLWGVAVVGVIWQLPEPSRLLLLVSLIFPVYYVLLSVILHMRR